MGLSDWLILAGVACLTAAALRSLWTRRRQGCSGCCGHCPGCRKHVQKP